MGWQTTFTLSRRAKGCHLVTDEVVRNVRDGLEDIKVLHFAFIHDAPHLPLVNLKTILHDFAGGDVVPLHVQCSSGSMSGWNVARLTGS